MTSAYKPTDENELAELISWAAAQALPLELVGSGSKRGLGCPVALKGDGAPARVDLSAIAGVVFYEPEELVISVRPGTPLEHVNQLLAERNQMLAFEPLDWGWLLAGESKPGTIGGAISVGSSGPRRVKAGAARDFVLGAHAINGRGESFKSGGRVVKNVTGYDLHKLMTGAYGTLGAFTEITLKVLPAPEKTYTLLIHGLQAERAVEALTVAANSPFEASGLAHIPAAEAARSQVSYVSRADRAITAVRIEGHGVSVAHRMEELKTLLAPFGPLEELHSVNSGRFWVEVRDAWLLPPDHQVVWRVSVPPSSGAAVVAASGAESWQMDWAGGLVWLGYESAAPGQGARIRAGMKEGGHALLVRAPEAVRREEAVFQPQAEALAKLSARVKAGFDPSGIFNPGRMGAVSLPGAA
ncbi:FAD-binding protein [Emcibacter sp. SYSU 3D8]|uniref:FAD-binding protein n=1 Tax=Emcibacter sp. SYSU 3D8 TaxID=3133969 RepID=UPI0031FEEC25